MLCYFFLGVVFFFICYVYYFWRKFEHLLQWEGPVTELRGRVDYRVEFTLMDSVGSTRLHEVQVLFTSHCRQREQVALGRLHCTLPASLSHSTLRNTHTHSQDTLPVNSSCETDYLYCTQAIMYRFTNSTVLCRSKLESSHGQNSELWADLAQMNSTAPFLSIDIKCGKTCPEKGIVLLHNSWSHVLYMRTRMPQGTVYHDSDPMSYQQYH